MTEHSSENKIKYYPRAGFSVPELLLPKEGTDLSKWSVIAVDQFTSAPDYWERADAFVGTAPSTLRLVLPEIYLSGSDGNRGTETVSHTIAGTMRQYLDQGILTSAGTGVVYVKRRFTDGTMRTGVLAALDLEQYDYRKGADCLIRPTEGTVVSRIPSRLKIRENAALELPHVLMLVNDPKNTLLPSLEPCAAEENRLYAFDLMEGGGAIEGYRISGDRVLDEFAERLTNLRQASVNGEFLYAVGDGNHSFAAAKHHWENLKAQGAGPDHPARFALCEIVNIHDPGIKFEPIHRLVFDGDFDGFLEELTGYFGEYAGVCEDFEYDREQILVPEDHPELPYHEVKIFTSSRSATLYLDKQADYLAVGAIQRFLDETGRTDKIDYVHDRKDILDLVTRRPDSIGIFLPAPGRSSLFETVARGDVLPRKTFSMGDAREKRYYLEARKIT